MRFQRCQFTPESSAQCSCLQLPREAPPIQAAEIEAWLEGLAGRYGRGVHPALAHMQRTADYSQLPWSLKKASLEAETNEESGQGDQNKILDLSNKRVKANVLHQKLTLF